MTSAAAAAFPERESRKNIFLKRKSSPSMFTFCAKMRFSGDEMTAALWKRKRKFTQIEANQNKQLAL